MMNRATQRRRIARVPVNGMLIFDLARAGLMGFVFRICDYYFFFRLLFSHKKLIKMC